MLLEKIDTNKVKLTLEVDSKEFEIGLNKAYNLHKNKFDIPGFRKGRAPRKLIEAQFGKDIFYDDAANYIFVPKYINAVEENDLSIVSKADMDYNVMEDGRVVFVAEVFVKPDVTVTDYFGVTYTKIDTTVTDEELNTEIDSARDKNARIVSVSDRPAQYGDTVTIDFKGTIDGEAFMGGTSEDYDLDLGSGKFIAGFEEQVVGKNLYERFDVHVVFPESYHVDELRGKAAVFDVLLKEIKIKEMPELNDEFAQDVSEFDTLEEYKESVRQTIQTIKDDRAKQTMENEIVDKVTEKAIMDVPQVMIDNKVEDMYDDFKRRLEVNGLNVEMYMRISGKTEQDLMDSYVESAQRQVKNHLTFEKIAQLENISVDEEMLLQDLADIAEYYDTTPQDMLEEISDSQKTALYDDLRVRKAIELVVKNAVAL